MSNYVYGQPILLEYKKEDLESDDLGMSGIVLQSHFHEYKSRGLLDETFYFFDYFRKLEWCSIEYKNLDGETLRCFNIRPEWIKPHPSYEKVGNNWYLKEN